MDTATRSRKRSLAVSLLGLALVVACLVSVGECRGFVYSARPVRRGLSDFAAGPDAAPPTSSVPASTDATASTDDSSSMDAPSASPAVEVASPVSPPAEVASPVDPPAVESPVPSGSSTGDATVFDATQYGAKADGKTDNAISFIKAWNAACKSGKPAKMLIPSGIYVSGPVIFQGPCNNGVPMEVEIQGTIKAYSDLSEYTSDEWFGFELVDGLKVKGGVFNGQGEKVWKLAGCAPREPCQHLPITLKFSKSKNLYVEGLTSVNSMGFHFGLLMVSNFTGYKLNISAPEESPNTDGIHISDSSSINITSSVIGTGDDCIGIIQGATDIVVHDVVCGPGHGISIGSLGKWPNEDNVEKVRVTNCSLKGTTNGVRIKSFPGNRELVASDIVFDNILMDNVKNPIIIDQNYGYHKITKPSSVQVHDVTFKNIRGTTISDNAVAFTCSSLHPCHNIQLQDIDLQYSGPALKKTFTSTCINAKVTVSGKSNPPACASS